MHAAIVDEGFAVWGEGHARTTEPRPLVAEVDRFFRTEIEPRVPEMRHGVEIGMQHTAGPDYYVARSFASLYVAVVWFGCPFDAGLAHDRLREALPELEAITLSLPPFDGPEAGGGAAAKRYA
jgi:hypothetical protein